MFTDRATIRLYAGKGGNGVVSWRREKYIPKGGPCGGNGGNGGSVILRADNNVGCLEWFHLQGHARAENGAPGGSNSCRGRDGENLMLAVPCGTLIKNVDTGEVLHDLTEPGQEVVICQGGRGGRGNESFKSSTNRAPRQWTAGKEGEQAHVELELKLIADVGLVGFPNAGKSTLINALAHTRVKTGAYPFTTLTPNLGYVTVGDNERVLLADVPGLIEGASDNRGLGMEFLRHIERTHVLLYVLDASGIDGRTPADDYQILQKELNSYQQELLDRPSLVLLNKVDTEDAELLVEDFFENNPTLNDDVLQVSAMEGTGLEEVKQRLQTLLTDRQQSS